MPVAVKGRVSGVKRERADRNLGMHSPMTSTDSFLDDLDAASCRFVSFSLDHCHGLGMEKGDSLPQQ